MPHAAATPERITHSTVTKHALPHERGTFALITLDNGSPAPATFGPEGLTEFSTVLDELKTLAEAGDIVAVAVTGVDKTFFAGADLRALPGIVTSAADSVDRARQLGQQGHAALTRLASLGVPSFAFINGTALGGGLEIALHCTYRIGMTGARNLGLPEVYLGLIPGWGGAYLLPRLIGVPAALKVIVENPLSNNRTLNVSEAATLGIVDDVVADFEGFKRFIANVLMGEQVVERREVEGLADADAQLIEATRKSLYARLSTSVMAPYSALDLIAAAPAAARTEAFAAEDEALARCMLSNQNAAALYAFELTSSYAKKITASHDGKPRPVTRIGVVGAGLMAAQLALVFATHLQVPVHMTDLDDERVNRGLGFVAAELEKSVAKSRLTADKAATIKALISGSSEISNHAQADWVIEAVFEDLAVKQAVLTGLERIVSENCVLATNTSSLSVAAMASVLQHPARLVGFHFFNPVAAMPLIEVVQHPGTDKDAVATALAVGASLRKTCVVVGDAPGFVVNRLLLKVMGDVLRGLDTGTPFATADHALAGLGLPMSTFALLQLVGPAVALHVAQVLNQNLGERFHVSPTLERVVAEQHKIILNDSQTDLLPEVSAAIPAHTTGVNPQTGDELRDYVLAELAREIQMMLDEGVVADRRDIDLCMILGAGWPFHLGGITPYLNSSGVAQPVLGHDLGGAAK